MPPNGISGRSGRAVGIIFKLAVPRSFNPPNPIVPRWFPGRRQGERDPDSYGSAPAVEIENLEF